MLRQPLRSRRQFLRDTGLVGSGLLLLGAAACTSDAASAELELVRLFSSDKVIAAGREQRLPLGLVDNGAPVVGEGGRVSIRVMFGDQLIDEREVASRLASHDHPSGDGSAPHTHSDIVRYFPLRTTLPDPGIYDLVVDVGGAEVSIAVQAFDPADIGVLLPGQRFPSLVTPTLDAPGPMNPICTLFDGPCPFHTRTAADVLTAGEPMAFLIASPAFCATSYCGPVLEDLIAAAPKFPSIVPIHLEVYENPTEVGGNINDPDIRPVAEFAALGLEFEPSLFLVGRDGVLVERIDNIFDPGELELALARIA